VKCTVRVRNGVGVRINIVIVIVIIVIVIVIVIIIIVVVVRSVRIIDSPRNSRSIRAFALVHEVVKLAKKPKQVSTFIEEQKQYHTSKTEGDDKPTQSVCSPFVSPVTLKSG